MLEESIPGLRKRLQIWAYMTKSILFRRTESVIQEWEARQDAVVFAISWRLSCFNRHLDHRQVFFNDDFTLELSSFLSLFLGCIAKKFSQQIILFLNFGRARGNGESLLFSMRKKEHAILKQKTVHFYVPL
jgi:hypothetical protein